MTTKIYITFNIFIHVIEIHIDFLDCINILRYMKFSQETKFSKCIKEMIVQCLEISSSLIGVASE